MPQLLKIFKDPISGLTHGVSAVAALIGALALWWLSPPEMSTRLVVLVYGASLVLLFAASSAYHLIKTSPAREQWLRKLDHSAIYLVIVGATLGLVVSLAFVNPVVDWVVIVALTPAFSFLLA
jgi:channel protein (hemolysin III family)